MNENNSSSGAEALGLCGPVEWSDFFEYAKRIHKKRIDCETVTKPAYFSLIIHREDFSVGVKAVPAVEVMA